MTTPKDLVRNPEQLKAYYRYRQGSIDATALKHISQVGDANRPHLELVWQQRRNQVKSHANYNLVRAVRHADELAGGRSFTELTPADWTKVIGEYRGSLGPQTFYNRIGLLRTYLRDLLGVEVLPPALNKATKLRKPKEEVVGQLVTVEERDAMLAWAADMGSGRSATAWNLEAVGILWALWDSGFRASELLSLNVSDVRFEGPGAWLALRIGAPDLKTGPRTIYVTECVPALRAWLSMHPSGTEPRAPLFPGLRNRSGLKSLTYDVFLVLFKRIADECGVNERHAGFGHITPHDFRHSCATRKAKLGWNESQLRKYFGWSSKSHMPSIYVHLNLDDMKAQVLRDNGITETGHKQLAAVQSDLERKLSAAQAALRALGL